MLLKLVAFDCDGVLFDSRGANEGFYNAILAHFGRAPMGPAAVDYVHSHTVWESLEHIFQDYEDLPEARQYVRTLDYSPFIPLMVEEPHLREFLQFLRPGCFTALATNRSTTTRAVLIYHGLEDYFDLVVSAQDVSRPKPDPEAFGRILNHFRLQPEEAIYIGDSRVDEEFARRSGVRLVAYRNPELSAAYYLDSFAQGPDLIKELRGR
ncbi:MAG: HAD family hydrolase [Deltaproteobacteria bacterium]|nr:HAD family hydrolase [Deltaproteobacteria bacterium]